MLRHCQSGITYHCSSVSYYVLSRFCGSNEVSWSRDLLRAWNSCRRDSALSKERIEWDAPPMCPGEAKFRKSDGIASLTEKTYTYSKNLDYIHTTVSSFSNHWQSNKSMSFEDKYEKKNLHYPLFFRNVHKKCFPEPRWIQKAPCPELGFMVAIPIIPYSKVRLLIFPTFYNPEA